MSNVNLSNPDNAFSETNVIASYSPNDLFYISMKKVLGANNEYSPVVDYTNCESVINNVDNESCDNVNFENNMQECVKKQLCINKSYAEEIQSIQNIHNGADEKYNDVNSVYGFSIINTVNIGMGIVFLVYLINRYSKRG
jgi:hypothetical protein